MTELKATEESEKDLLENENLMYINVSLESQISALTEKLREVQNQASKEKEV